MYLFVCVGSAAQTCVGSVVKNRPRSIFWLDVINLNVVNLLSFLCIPQCFVT